MTDTINYTADLIITDGPSIECSGSFEAEAYEKIEALIPHGTVETTVKVQPSLLTKLQAIMIIADLYTNLTFEVDAYAVTYTLDGPLLLIGKGNIGALGATCNDLLFTNSDAVVDRNVTIMVARSAV